MKYTLVFLLLSSCILVRSPIINEIEPNNKKWHEIYLHEMQIAKDNGDLEAWMFFLHEYQKEVQNLK